MHTSPLGSSLSQITIGPEVIVRNLVMFPLVGPPAAERDTGYLTLDEALGQGWVEVRELTEQGSVPELTVLNRGARPALILDGEELVGAKQNRIVNLSILVPPVSQLTIPVSCVEAGRWRARSRVFTSAPRGQFASGRARRMARVSQSIAERGTRASDQAEVWSDIALKSARLDARSETSAMDAMFERHADAVEAFVAACAPVDRQVGALFAVNGHVLGLDVFDCAPTLRKMLPKLVRSCAIEAIDAGTAGDPSMRQAVPVPPAAVRAHAKRFMAAITAAPQNVTKALGLGDDVRIGAGGLTGAALVFEGELVHLGALVTA